MDRTIDHGDVEEFMKALKVFGFNVDFRYRFGKLEMKVRKARIKKVARATSIFRIVHTHRRQRL